MIEIYVKARERRGWEKYKDISYDAHIHVPILIHSFTHLHVYIFMLIFHILNHTQTHLYTHTSIHIDFPHYLIFLVLKILRAKIWRLFQFSIFCYPLKVQRRQNWSSCLVGECCIFSPFSSQNYVLDQESLECMLVKGKWQTKAELLLTPLQHSYFCIVEILISTIV